MRELHELSPFRRDLKWVKKSGRYGIDEIDDVIEMLRLDSPLPERLQDHPLSGAWSAANARDCHIKSDLLLIYAKTEGALHLFRLGSHSDIFGR